MASFSFNAATVDPTSKFDCIPEGVYIAQLVKSDIKPTKDGTGSYISAQFEIIQGEFAKRNVFSIINVRNKSEKAEGIGQQQFSQLCHAVGRLQITDTAELHNIPLKIKVKIRKDSTGQYPDQNDIDAYEAIKGQAAMPQAQATKPANAAPWG